jgi:surfeit locus 1 family protein
MSKSLGQRLITPRWIITTVLVLIAAAVMVRLGIWQLDRLAQRRAFNASVEAQVSAPALDLNSSIPANLTGMEYRPVVVRGTYDPQNQVVLRNQALEGQLGDHLLTPLRISGSDQAVLVDRGFVPLDEVESGSLAKYAQPGEVTLKGQVRLGHVPTFAGVRDPALAPGQKRLDAWNSINLPRIAQQMPYPLLPVYVELAPASAGTNGPVTSLDQPDLTEGPHMGYAFQWFSFAAILLVGYPFFIRTELRREQTKDSRKRTAARG